MPRSMASTKVDKIVSVYQELAQYPILSSAEIISNVNPAIKHGIKVESLWKQRNLEKQTTIKFIRDFTYDGKLELLSESFPSDASTEVLKSSSNDNTLKAILREINIDNKRKQYIEIWDYQHLLKTYDLNEFDLHGDVYTDPALCAFHISPDNKRLLYMAEKKLKKSEPFYKQKCKDKKKPHTADDETSRGSEYVFKPDWGEQYVSKHRSVVVIMNFIEDTIVPLVSIPDDNFPTQVTWAPNGVDIVGIVYKLHARYLGILTAENLSCRSPRFSGDGTYLIWLERNISSPHHHVHRLMYLKWNTLESPAVLIDTVPEVLSIAKNKKFYGLYNDILPKRCWSDDYKFIFFSTPQRSTIKSYMVNLSTKLITEIDNPENASLSILDVYKNHVVFNKFTPIQPSQLVVGKFNPQSSDIEKLFVKNCTQSLTLINKFHLIYENVEYVYDNSDTVKDFNFTYLGKPAKSKRSTPLIVIAHGGPHTAFSNEFNLTHAVFASLGFGVLLINYRGSTGMGGNNVEYILGKIGESDIIDCVSAINAAVKKYSWIDPRRISLFAGSHGGFINAHLSAQFPDLFKSVVMRNPVIDLAAMFSISDIPDWCSAETGNDAIATLPETLPAPESNYSEFLQKLLEHSPILQIDKVKSPTLIALGANDLRVPSSQGKLWYYGLLNNKVPTKLYMYNDNHSLLKEEVELDFVVNTVHWIHEFDE